VGSERLRREAYYDAAFAVLAERGPGDLTIAALCARLQVTKGSFYHHFTDMAEFVDRLLEHWAQEHATRLIALSESVTDPAERFDLLEGIAAGLPHGAEAAIRAWSWSNESVAAAQRAVDAARIGHLTASGLEAGLPPDEARRLATISMSLLVGMQQLERPARAEVMQEVFATLRGWALGEVPLPIG
jgi:AcrR family transcriptional regulator